MVFGDSSYNLGPLWIIRHSAVPAVPAKPYMPMLNRKFRTTLDRQFKLLSRSPYCQDPGPQGKKWLKRSSISILEKAV